MPEDVRDLTPKQGRNMLASGRAGKMTLLDVRQDWEYEEAHIPGARLVPLPELPDRLGELDPSHPVLAYCRSGKRSLAAARFLAGQGFAQVFNLLGGIMAWDAEVAVGPVESGVFRFRGNEAPQDILALAWGMEEALRLFYLKAAADAAGTEARGLYERLAGFEEVHKRAVFALYRKSVPTPLTEEAFTALADTTAIEGGVAPEELQRGLNPHDIQDTVQFAMMVEAQALDLYLRLSYRAEQAETAKALQTLAQEEKAHLKILGKFLDAKP